MKVYLIAGLGCDQTLFDHAILPTDWDTVFIPWVEPTSERSLQDYAKSMAKQIEPNEPFTLLGVSMGGMVAMEMAQFLTPKKVILISSAKHSGELPWFLKVLRFLPLHLLFPMRYLYRFAGLANRGMGLRTPEAKSWFQNMLQKSSPKYLRFAIHAIVWWKLKPCKQSTWHIHGTNDYMLPIKNVKPDQVVKGGGHFMIWNKPEAISFTAE